MPCDRCEDLDDSIPHTEGCPNGRKSLWRKLFGSLPPRNPSLELNRAIRRRPAVTYFGITLPTSIRAFPPEDHTIRAAKFPTSSVDWAGSDWESPTALTFETVTLDARQCGFSAALPDHPERFALAVRYALDHGVADMRHALTHDGYVIDPAGLTVTIDHPHGVNELRLTGRAWPAVPGVTVHAEDTTL